MKKLIQLYEQKLDTPDVLLETPFSSGNGNKEIMVAVNFPLPDQGIHETSLTTLGLSSIYTGKEKFELFIEIAGKLSEPEITKITASIFNCINKAGKCADGGILQDAGIELFSASGMTAVLFANRGLMDEDFLDEDKGAIRLFELVPLFKEEADNLSAEYFKDRGSIVLYADIGYKNSGRKAAHRGICLKAVKNIWKDILSWYSANKVLRHDTLAQVFDAGEQEVSFPALPEDVRVNLSPAVLSSFSVLNSSVNVNAYALFNAERVIQVYNDMNELLDSGTFDENHKNVIKNDLIEKKWWNHQWVPFAMNSAGDMLCIDYSPGKKGVKGQIINFLADQGPVETPYHSFFHWLLSYKNDLYADVYQVTESGLLEEQA